MQYESKQTQRLHALSIANPFYDCICSIGSHSILHRILNQKINSNENQLRYSNRNHLHHRSLCLSCCICNLFIMTRTIRTPEGKEKTFTTDEAFLSEVQKIYKATWDGQPYPSEIHWLPENIQQATEYIVEYTDNELIED